MTSAGTQLLVHTVAVLAPFVALGIVVHRSRPGLRRRMAALLASVDALLGIVLLDVVAEQAGWWSLSGTGPLGAGQPLDLLLAWAVAWGALPTLLDRWSTTTVLTALAVLDLLALPLLPGLALGPGWAVGELVGLALVALPAVLLGRWTAQRRRLPARTVLQALLAGKVLFGLAPLVALATGGALVGPGPQRWTGLQLVVLGTVVAGTATLALLRRGQGTPWPWDPPRRLVTDGPYRYVRNPMQLGATLVLLGEALLLASLPLAGLAVVGVCFSATVARLHEDAVLGARFGAAWDAHAAAVRPWWPRWRPSVREPATLWVARDCAHCAPLGRWVEARCASGLVVRPAEERPVPVQRVTHEAADGWSTSGVDAVGAALEHIDLGWALAGWVLRLPGVVQVGTVLADAVGFGHATAPDGSVAATCAPPGTPPRAPAQEPVL